MVKRHGQTLTKSEFLVMNSLWDITTDATINDILLQYPDPKPAYTTIATFLRILVEKQFVGRKSVKGMGKMYVYYPLLTREKYRDMIMSNVKDTFFNSSASDIVSYFIEDGQLSAKDILELLEIINDN